MRTYVMLGDPEHFSADSVQQWLAADLESDPAAGSRRDRQQLLAHLAALFERGAALRAAVAADPARFDRVAILRETEAPVSAAARAAIRAISKPGEAA